MRALVLERCYNCDIIEAMPHPNKGKKDPLPSGLSANLW